MTARKNRLHDFTAALRNMLEELQSDAMDDNDPVTISDAIQHPVEFGALYRDLASGFTGKATGVAYTAGESIMVILTAASIDNAPAKSHYISIKRLEPVMQSRFNPAHNPRLPITFFEEYQDEITGYVGTATGIIYSMNKCVQVILTADNPKTIEENVCDIQNLKPVSDEVPEHDLTSNTNPGAPRVLPEWIASQR